MKLNKMELMALEFFNDGNVELTIQRLCMAAMISPKQEVKKMLCGLIEELQGSKGKTDTIIKNDDVSMKGK